MFKRLMALERQVSSLEGANLEIAVSSTSSLFKEIKSFIRTYSSEDIDALTNL